MLTVGYRCGAIESRIYTCLWLCASMHTCKLPTQPSHVFRYFFACLYFCYAVYARGSKSNNANNKQHIYFVLVPTEWKFFKMNFKCD